MPSAMLLRHLTLAAVLLAVAALPAAVELSHARRAEAAPGDHLWSKRFGDADVQSGRSVAVDGTGNVFLTGEFYGSADFGGGTLTSAGGDDIFVAKFDGAGAHLWSKRFGDADSQQGRSVAVDAAGNVFLAGFFSGSADFGGGALTSAGSFDVFIAKFDSAGAHLWSKRFGDLQYQDGYSVAVDAAGNVFLAGFFSGSADFGGGTLTSAGFYDIFVAKFDSAGAHLWSKRFGDAGTQYGYSVAVDAAGNVFLTGSFDGSADFGGGTLTSAGGNDVFIAKFDGAGAHLWSKRFGDAGYQYGYSVAVDAAGNVFLTGFFDGSADFGGGTLTSAGAWDVFIAKFDGAGAHLWSKRFGDADDQRGYSDSVTVDAAGNVFLTGFFAGSADFGGGTLTSAGSYDVFIAKFDSAGAHLWSKRFGDADSQQGRSVAVDAAGNVFLTGGFGGSADFGGGTLTSAGDYDIFIAKFDGIAASVGGVAEFADTSALPAATSSGDRFVVGYAISGALLAALVISGGGLFVRGRRRAWH